MNRLVKVAKNNEDVASYLYDESGLRLKKQGNDKAVYYVFDTGGNVLYEQENREYLEYIYVLGKHFARVDGNLDNPGQTKKYFYHTDHLGSTVAVTDEAGQTVWTGEYTPFGGKHSVVGEMAKAAKFTGKDLDEDIGLYYFNARWYDQEIGRFISEDPIRDGMNWYIYSSNNPLGYIDPSGLTAEDVISMANTRIFLEDRSTQLQRLITGEKSEWEKRRDNLTKLTENIDGDSAIALAQAGLVSLGYNLGDYGNGGVDGFSGKLTQDALRHFQGLIGEERTGDLDNKTATALYLAAISGLSADDLKSRPMGLLEGDTRYWTREQWGAREPLGITKEIAPIKEIILHHTAGGPKETIQGIQRYHMTPQDQRGPKGGPWDDIGYHWVIGRDGSIFEGRPLGVRGSHAGPSGNRGTIGIAFMGSFDNFYSPNGLQLSTGQISSGHSLINSLKRINSLGQYDVKGHHNYGKPDCPGFPIKREFMP